MTDPRIDAFAPRVGLSTIATYARRDLPIALLAAGTTWFAMLSWRGFSDVWGAYLGPLFLLAVVIAVSGVLLRVAPRRRRLGVVIEVLLVAVVVWLMLGGSLLHPVSSSHHVAHAVHEAWFSASTFVPPIPGAAPSIAPLMIPCGALALLTIDVLACWARRVAWAGLALAVVYGVPIGLPGGGVHWEIFAGAAAGFLLMLFSQQSAQVARWGRPLGESAAGADPQGFGVSTGASRASATTVGATALVLAVILPLFIPTLHLHGPRIFGPGGSGGVTVDDPMTDLRRNLERGTNVPLLEVTTDDPHPSYLRIAVLTRFDGSTWTTGSRAGAPSQIAQGLLPITEQYLSRRLQRDAQPYQYDVTATSSFESTWLPTQFPVSSITAPGTWQYDRSTMDFHAVGSDTNLQGISYGMTAVKPKLSAYSMVHSLSAPQEIQTPYTDLPTGEVSKLATRLAFKVTENAPTRFQKMVALQDWFRNDFTYSIKKVDAPLGDGTAALDRFLAPGKGGRVGYCAQFASAFAVMARILDIPARVAVGFLQPSKNPDGSFTYSAYDMHAWPEVFFRGSGWVRFEPTPSSRTAHAPTYTTAKIEKPSPNREGPKPSGISQPSQAATPTTTTNQDPPEPTSPPTRSGTPWSGVLATLLAVALMGSLLAVPGAVRRSRRARRLAGGAEDAWSELRDSAIDLGVNWPRGRSPHETGQRLVEWFGPEPDGPPLERPPRGPGLAPAAESALNRIVLMVEQVRYARDADDVPGALADDVRVCVVALEHGCTRGALRRAGWLPRSVISRAHESVGASPSDERRTATPGSTVDHVG